MTAVDVEALDKLREEIGDELAGWPIGNGYYSTDIGTDDAGELADFLLAGSLAPLLAEVRRGRALREAVEGRAEQWSSTGHLVQATAPTEADQAIAQTLIDVAADLRAALAAVDAS